MKQHKLASRGSLPRGIPAHIALAKKCAPEPPKKKGGGLFRGLGSTCVVIIVVYLLAITLG